jgi:L-fuconolactonase
LTDTHQHLWDKTQLDLPWLESVPALDRNFTMADYLPQARALGVTRSVYVEVDVRKGREDDELGFVTRLCQEGDNPLAGIVAAGNPMDPGFAARVERLVTAPFVKGVRQVLHTPAQAPGLCVDPRFVEGVRLLGRKGLSFDVCIRPDELGDAVELARRCPETTLVIDHCGNASPEWFWSDPTHEQDAAGRIATFRAALEELAALDNTICKLSGIVVRLEPERPIEALQGTLDFCVSTFGHERAMIGSDWPVCTLRTDMGSWLELARAFVERLPRTARAAILSENAARVYRLD